MSSPFKSDCQKSPLRCEFSNQPLLSGVWPLCDEFTDQQLLPSVLPLSDEFADQKASMDVSPLSVEFTIGPSHTSQLAQVTCFMSQAPGPGPRRQVVGPACQATCLEFQSPGLMPQV